MTTNVKQAVAGSRQKNGFTLVELSVVLLVIGLLIGGVLRGIELYNAAQITATITQVKDYESAMSGFRSAYNGLPGDIKNPISVVPGCTDQPCSYWGDGNGQVGSYAGNPISLGDSEQKAFWAQLALSKFITGVTPLSEANDDRWGTVFPAAKIGGGWHLSYATGSDPGMAGSLTEYGHYLFLHSEPYDYSPILEVSQAMQIDKKIDDGIPEQGNVIAGGDGTGGSCVYYGVYRTENFGRNCHLFIRIHE